MRQCWHSLSFLVLFTVTYSALASPFENTAVVRTVELGGSAVHVTTTYAIRALKAQSKVYTLALGTEEKERTSWLEVKVKGQAKPLPIEAHGFDSTNGFHLIDVELPKALGVNSTLNLVLDTIQTHATHPWPEKAGQNDEQGLKYMTDLFVLSPYKTSVQRTKLRSPTPRVHSYSTPKKVDSFTLENPVAKSGATITYGPYNNIEASANSQFISDHQQPIEVHYDYDHPVLEVLQLKRSAEISHWGANLNIQDDIQLQNTGPQLKGHFSRLDHQSQAFYKRNSPHVLPSLTLHLPAGIRNTYYYDIIGNVSTSHLRAAPSAPKGSQSNRYSILEMKPRYPLMGGWNYTFTLGWDSPLEDSASYDKSTGKYIVEVPIMTPIPGAIVNNAELTIILPEGASDIEFAPPFPAVSNKISTHVTYLDTIGRPALTFEYKDLTTKHAMTIFVSYRVPLSAHLKKPVAVAAVFFSLFALAVVGRRIDLTIHKKKLH
ncbi:oligosaccharyl transferase alpha subunit [Infundibulicybe gibba]|nr:oligosaccharyl transferase alpha subunit [Infundibulicybe gibba]